MHSYFQGNLIRGQAAQPVGGMKAGGWVWEAPWAVWEEGCEGKSWGLGDAFPFPASREARLAWIRILHLGSDVCL